MQRTVNDNQRVVLDWLATHPGGDPPLSAYKTVTIALQTRGLAKVSRPHGVWTATLTDAGWYYHEHGRYPPPDPGLTTTARTAPPAPRAPTTPSQKRRSTAVKAEPEAEPEFVVDSPMRFREQGFKPRGDTLRMADERDPWDARVMITVKEAAWLLSLTEHEIRRAVTAGEIERVFIGAGTTHYRVVYGVAPRLGQ